MKGKFPPGSKWRKFASIPPYVVGPANTAFLTSTLTSGINARACSHCNVTGRVGVGDNSNLTLYVGRHI